MACIQPDGSLSPSARAILALLQSPLAEEEIAARTGLPLYRVRSALREMSDAGLVGPERGLYGLRSEPESSRGR